MNYRTPKGRELPPPATERTGWPWDCLETEQALPGEESHLPKISIITPTFNQGDFIEETIRSVLLQSYPNLEYIVIDGKSTDQTSSILDRYSGFIDHVISEKDRGQSHAINKGLALATGDLIAWLNSDDFYCPGALLSVGRAFVHTPGAVIAGDVLNFDDEREWIVGQPGLIHGVTLFWTAQSRFQQPGVFMPKALWDACGPIDESLTFAMDLDLFCRLEQQKAKVVLVDEPLAKYRWHSSAKSTLLKNVCFYEQGLVSQRYLKGNQKLLLQHHLVMSDNLLSRSIKNFCSGRFGEAQEQLKILARLKLLHFLPLALARIPWRIFHRILSTGRITQQSGGQGVVIAPEQR